MILEIGLRLQSVLLFALIVVLVKIWWDYATRRRL